MIRRRGLVELRLLRSQILAGSIRDSSLARCCGCFGRDGREICSDPGAHLARVVRRPYCRSMSDLSTWTKRPTPGLVPLDGAVTLLEPLDWERHGEGLFAAT